MLPIIAAAGMTLLTTLFVFICFLLIIVILVQKPTGGGLVGAFGGAGGVQDFLGAKMGSKITWFTVILFSSFVILACLLTVLVKHDHNAPRTPAVATTAPASAAPETPSAEKPTVEKPAATATTTAPATEKTP